MESFIGTLFQNPELGMLLLVCGKSCVESGASVVPNIGSPRA